MLTTFRDTTLATQLTNHRKAFAKNLACITGCISGRR
jgi:hypothetical protein